MENEGTLDDLLQTHCILYSECDSGGILWSKSFSVTVVCQRSTLNLLNKINFAHIQTYTVLKWFLLWIASF